MLVGQAGGHPAPGRPLQEAQLKQVGLIDIHDGIRLLGDGGGDGLQPHRSPLKLFNNGQEHLPVNLVQAGMVHLQPGQGLLGHLPGDDPLGPHLGIVPHPLQEAVGHPGCAPGPFCQLLHPSFLYLHLQHPGRAADDGGDGRLIVEVQAVNGTEALPEGVAEEGKAGGGPDEGEGGEGKAESAGPRPLAYYQVQGIVLQGGVEHLLHHPAQAVDLIKEEDVLPLEAGEDGGQVAGPLYGGAGGGADAHPHLGGDDIGQGGLAQAGGAEEEDMVQGLLPLLGGLNGDLQVLLDLRLPDELGKPAGAEGGLKGLVLGFSIAAPVGPIGVLCIRRTLAEGRAVGFASGLGAATADAIYGSIAAFGLTLISAFLISQRLGLGLIGGAFLCYLGIKTLTAKPAEPTASFAGKGLLGAYGSTFFLTLSNPITILSFVAIFAGFGFVNASRDLVSAGLLVLGVFGGSASWWFLLSGGVSLFRSRFDLHALRWVNRISGSVITGFGLLALMSLVERG